MLTVFVQFILIQIYYFVCRITSENCKATLSCLVLVGDEVSISLYTLNLI